MIPTQSPGARPKEATSRYAYTVLFFGAPFRDKPRQKFFLFTSLAAIYDVFTVEQIGCSLAHLYNLKIADGAAYAGRRCIIKREPLTSKRQNRG